MIFFGLNMIQEFIKILLITPKICIYFQKFISQCTSQIFQRKFIYDQIMIYINGFNQYN